MFKTPGRQAPRFWFSSGSWQEKVLRPLGALYAKETARRLKKQVMPFGVPVICCGNIALGGSGKTPVALALARIFQENGEQVFFLTRGYGGSEKGPVRVNPKQHQVRQTGDEALLLSRFAPTVVAKNRGEGARFAALEGASLIIADDGLQNPSLPKHISLAVIDGAVGFGNGQVFPAGPLREKPEEALKRVDAVILTGPDETGIKQRIRACRGVDFPVFQTFSVQTDIPERLYSEPFVAFAAIGRPEKFFQGLKKENLHPLAEAAFPDHHIFTAAELEALQKTAEEHQARLVTTLKDAVRLPEALRQKVLTVGVQAVWEDEAEIRAFFEKKQLLRNKDRSEV